MLEYYAFVDNNRVKAFVFDTADRATDSKAYVNKAMYKKSEWVRNSYTFVSDEKVTTYRIVLRASGGSAYIDDISLTELPKLITTDSLTKETNHILNLSDKKLYTKIKDDYVSNDFSNADRTANISADGWVQMYTKSASLARSPESNSGEYALKINGYSEYITYITLKENTDYEISAYVRGNSNSYIRLKSLTNGTTPSKMKTIAQKTATAGDKYKKVVFRFNSGSVTKVWLQLAVDEGKTAFFDDIKITAYNEPEPEDKTDHYFSFADEGLYKDTGIYNEKTSSNIFTNTDFALEDGSANISKKAALVYSKKHMVVMYLLLILKQAKPKINGRILRSLSTAAIMNRWA